MFVPRPHRRLPLRPIVVACALLPLLAGRAAAQPVPDATLAVPAETFLGDAVTFTVTFDNTSAADTGYGPFVDLIFPVNGADGAAGTDVADGLDFSSATFRGQPVTSVELTFPGPGPIGCVAHPYAVDAAHSPLQVCGTPGDKLVVLQLPFGSFSPDQPPAVISVDATATNLADLGTPLPIRTRAGFQFGADPLDVPAGDPTILSPGDSAIDSSTWTESATNAPTLLSLAKANDATESETATGPNYPRTWTITVDIATGQTITAFEVHDFLPDNA